MSHQFEDLADEVPNMRGDPCLDGRRRVGLKIVANARATLSDRRHRQQQPGNTLVMSAYQPSLPKLKFMGEA